MIKKYIDAAISRSECDIVLKNASYADVFCQKLRKGDIAICGDRIAGIGDYSGKKEYDCTGFIVLPAFIDSHVHIESSQLSPEGFASLVVPRGTATVIADPHEIANVCGLAGVEYIACAAKNTPLEVKIMLPPCVPATPFETSGATLSAGDITGVIDKKHVFGLAEFMNYPAVTAGDSQAVAKLEAAIISGKPCDGHAPSLTGKALNAYLCGGIATDHECESEAEIEEKLSKGVYIALRHGSTARNLKRNCKMITAGNLRRFTVCTDDRHAADLAEYGHIDDALRTMVAEGVEPIAAVTCATLNAAECYGLEHCGAIAPFYFADIAVVDDLKNFNVKYVFKRGKPVAENGKPLFESEAKNLPQAVKNTVHVKEITPDKFKLKLKGERAKAITLTGGSIVTGCEAVAVKSQDGDACVKGTDLLKLAVVERHGKNGNIGLGLLKGYGFMGGALGVTVSHDSHNLIILGDDNGAMASVANVLAQAGGGLAVAESGGAAHTVSLDIGGLMSSEQPETFIEKSKALYGRAYAMGVKRDFDAFLSLAFLSLAVVPHLKLLDTGLFDVDKFDFTDINSD